MNIAENLPVKMKNRRQNPIKPFLFSILIKLFFFFSIHVLSVTKESNSDHLDAGVAERSLIITIIIAICQLQPQ